MFKLKGFIFLLSGVFATALLGDNQIHITATVNAKALTKTKIIQVNSSEIRQDVYLKNNYGGLTIALTDSSYGSSTLMNYRALSTNPINFSDDTHTKSTKVAELIISQKENRGSLGVTISVK